MTDTENRTSLSIFRLSSVLDGSSAEPQGRVHLGGMVTSVAFFIPSEGSKTAPLLLVANNAAGAVHIVDVVSRAPRGYLARPGTITPVGVAANKGIRGPSTLVAVSYLSSRLNEGGISLYSWSAMARDWIATRTIEHLRGPIGLRFNVEATLICVADFAMNDVRWFSVSDGRLFGEAVRVPNPADVEEIDGGWFILANDNGQCSLFFVTTDGSMLGPFVVVGGSRRTCAAVTAVPGGLALTDHFGVTLYPTAMWIMAPARVVWMVAVARGMRMR